jgi:hypothetical protein
LLKTSNFVFILCELFSSAREKNTVKYDCLYIPLISLLFLLTACSGDDEVSVNRYEVPNTDGMPPSFPASRMLDADNDGDLDIVLAADKPRTSDTFLLNNGTGIYAIIVGAIPDHRYVGVEGLTVYIETADFNSDGNADLVSIATDYNQYQIQLYFGNGDGTFSDATENITNSAGSAWFAKIGVGDFDLDGSMDFITSGIKGINSTPRIFLNDGLGNFSIATITSTDGVWTFEYDRLLAAQEIRANNGNVTDINAYEDQGNPLFLASDFAVGDINNDGKLDIVGPRAGNREGNVIATFINNSSPGNLSFNIIYTVADAVKGDAMTDETNMIDAALLDINSDGHLDMVASKSIAEMSRAGEATTPLMAYINQGDGSFIQNDSVFSPSQPGFEHARQYLVADFNQDGQDDLFVADVGFDAQHYLGYPNKLLLNDGNGSLVDVSAANLGTSANYTHGASVGDVNGDSFPDLLLNTFDDPDRANPHESRLWINNGDGSFHPATSVVQ